MLHTSIDCGFDSSLFHVMLDFCHDLLDKFISGILPQVNLFHQIIINIRF